MRPNLRITDRDWERLQSHFASSFRTRNSPETGALAILGECITSAKHEFIVSKILLPGPDDLKTATSGEVVFDSSYIRRAHLEMRKMNLAGIATFHTHPFADTEVSFSGYDNYHEPQLVENLIELDPRTRLVSVVAGKRSQFGRVFATPSSPQPLGQLIVVGERLSYLGLDGKPPLPLPKAEEVFDRGRALTGSGALYRLSRMTVAVVGASGTGSLMCELLARAGCKRIILIDHDIVKFINLNRILHAIFDHAKRGEAKVHVISRAIEALGLGCKVEAVVGSILEDNVLRRVLDADAAIGCIDRDLPRNLLSKVCYRYLLPYIDVGSEIGGDEAGIVSVDSRVSYVAPNRPCLMCSGLVTPRRLEYESLTAPERKRKERLGYSDDLMIEQPSVMDVNMRAAGSGMLVLRHLLQPFMVEPLPIKITDNAVTYRTIALQKAQNANDNCPTCRSNRRFGYGDCGPQIGYDAEVAARILGDEAAVLPKKQSWLPQPHFIRQLADKFHRKSAK
jgi:molybdopterin/thiamine biosynthesis adenylyltransferase